MLSSIWTITGINIHKIYGNDGAWNIDIMKWLIYTYEETVREWYVSWHVHMIIFDMLIQENYVSKDNY